MIQNIVGHKIGEEKDSILSQVTGGVSDPVLAGSVLGAVAGIGTGAGVSMHKMKNEKNGGKVHDVVGLSVLGGGIGGAVVGGGVAKAGKYIATRARRVTVHPTGDNV